MRTIWAHGDLAVVSLLIVNSEGFKPTDLDTVFKAVGLDALSYSPPSATTTAGSWPSLGSLIDSGKRLVTFMDSGADFTSVPYIIDGASNLFSLADQPPTILRQNSQMCGRPRLT